MTTKREKGLERARKIGSRQEEIDVEVYPDEADVMRADFIALLSREEALDEERKQKNAEYKTKIAALRQERAAIRRVISDGHRRVEVEIEEWLTRSNEVIRIRVDTGEQLGDPRKARAEELQEELFKQAAPTAPATPPARAKGQPEGDAADDFGDAEGVH